MRGTTSLTWTVRTLAVASCVLAPAARARECGTDETPATDACSRLELAMGLMAAQSSYLTTPLAFDEGDAGSLAGATQLVAPFEGAPFSHVWAMGPRLEARQVIRHLRVTTGVQFAFPRWRLAEVTGTWDVGGVDRLITVRSLRSRDWRFGLGAEFSLGPVTAFGDLVGTLHWTTVELSLDGRVGSWCATTFSYAVQGGLRVDLGGGVFVAATAEYGLVGEERLGMGVAVGGAIRM